MLSKWNSEGLESRSQVDFNLSAALGCVVTRNGWMVVCAPWTLSANVWFTRSFYLHDLFCISQYFFFILKQVIWTLYLKAIQCFKHDHSKHERENSRPCPFYQGTSPTFSYAHALGKDVFKSGDHSHSAKPYLRINHNLCTPIYTILKSSPLLPPDVTHTPRLLKHPIQICISNATSSQRSIFYSKEPTVNYEGPYLKVRCCNNMTLQ